MKNATIASYKAEIDRYERTVAIVKAQTKYTDGYADSFADGYWHGKNFAQNAMLNQLAAILGRWDVFSIVTSESVLNDVDITMRQSFERGWVLGFIEHANINDTQIKAHDWNRLITLASAGLSDAFAERFEKDETIAEF